MLKVGHLKKGNQRQDCCFVPNSHPFLHRHLLSAHSLDAQIAAFSTIDRIVHSTDGSAERFASREESLLSAQLLDTSQIFSNPPKNTAGLLSIVCSQMLPTDVLKWREEFFLSITPACLTNGEDLSNARAHQRPASIVSQTLNCIINSNS